MDGGFREEYAGSLDPSRFPRAAEYIAGLPGGLRAHPTCLARAVIAEPYGRDHGAALRSHLLAEPVAELLRGSLDPDAWVPEVVLQTANLLVRDVGFESDAAFYKWTYDISRELFDKPFVRTFMRLLSPTLIVVGSAKRWGSFHRGSTLAAGQVQTPAGRARTRATLTFPEGLFPKLFLQGLEHAFGAALAGARARNPMVRLVESTRTEARYDVTWE